MTKLAGIAVTVMVVRIISPHDFGVFSVALVVYAIVSSFGELGLSACIARRDLEPDLAGTGCGGVVHDELLVLSVAMALLASPIAGALGAPEAAAAIRVLSASIFLSSLTTVSAAMLVRDFRQGRLFAATAIAFLPSNAVLVLLPCTGTVRWPLPGPGWLGRSLPALSSLPLYGPGPRPAGIGCRRCGYCTSGFPWQGRICSTSAV